MASPIWSHPSICSRSCQISRQPRLEKGRPVGLFAYSGHTRATAMHTQTVKLAHDPWSRPPSVPFGVALEG